MGLRIRSIIGEVGAFYAPAKPVVSGSRGCRRGRSLLSLRLRFLERTDSTDPDACTNYRRLFDRFLSCPGRKEETWSIWPDVATSPNSALLPPTIFVAAEDGDEPTREKSNNS